MSFSYRYESISKCHSVKLPDMNSYLLFWQVWIFISVSRENPLVVSHCDIVKMISYRPIWKTHVNPISTRRRSDVVATSATSLQRRIDVGCLLGTALLINIYGELTTNWKVMLTFTFLFSIFAAQLFKTFSTRTQIRTSYVLTQVITYRWFL